MVIVRAALAAGFLALAAGAAPARTSQACGPSNGLNFVCGLNQPEDLIQVGSGKWIIASGMERGGSISLIDADAKRAQRLYTGAMDQIRFDRKTFPECAGAPDIGQFNTHGLALRPWAAGTYRLYAVTHLPYESIQVFTLDAGGAACMRLRARLPCFLALSRLVSRVTATSRYGTSNRSCRT